MINLISHDQFSELRAARRNVTLLRFNIITFLVCLVAIGTLVASFVFLMVQNGLAKDALENANQEKTKVAADIKRVDTFKKDLAAAKSILSNDISLSNLAIIMTDAIPTGAVVDTLSVNPRTLSEQQTIVFSAKSANDAVVAKKQFNESRYIDKTFIQDVTDQTGTLGIDQSRPFRITMTYYFDVATIIADTKARTEKGL